MVRRQWEAASSLKPSRKNFSVQCGAFYDASFYKQRKNHFLTNMLNVSSGSWPVECFSFSEGGSYMMPKVGAHPPTSLRKTTNQGHHPKESTTLIFLLRKTRKYGSVFFRARLEGERESREADATKMPTREFFAIRGNRETMADAPSLSSSLVLYPTSQIQS